MHAAERERLILEYLHHNGFVSFKDLERRVEASPATIRRDLERLTTAGLITRVRGGAKRAEGSKSVHAPAAPEPMSSAHAALRGVPFQENIHRNRPQKEAIGRAAASLCNAGEAIMIDGGSTTLQMCQHLADLNMQVLTNSLHIVNALLMQSGTRVLVPAGQVFREQHIILSAEGDDGMSRFHAPKLFMGAASVGAVGLMQTDIILIGAERRLMERADEIIVLVDSSKFDGPSGHVVCPLEEIDVIVTDRGVRQQHRNMLEKAGVRLVVARE
jgi:DeoR family ulaG and ulaABCDEF operon transcriptional repressor